jgi:regulator of sigma E protease
MFQGILIFVLFLGPLIFFHELGHFFFARLFGVKVEVFSIGFGPKLFKWKWGETEYALSVIPLGGYVKMFGDDPFRETPLTEEEQKVAFNYKSKWARFWIVFGGPLANMILAFILYFGLVMTGEKVPETRFGHITQSSLLYDMGFRSGDALREVNGKQFVSFDDLNVAESQIETVKVERMGSLVALNPKYNAMDFVDLLMEHSAASLRAPIFVDPTGSAWMIVKKAGEFDPSYSLEEAALSSNSLYLQSITKEQSETESKDKKEGFDLASEIKLGADVKELPIFKSVEDFWSYFEKNKFFPIDVMVGSIVMGSPADKVGLKQGDIIRQINGNKIKGFEELRQLVQKTKEKEAIQVSFLRDGKNQQINLIPEAREVDKKTVMTIGIFSAQRTVQPKMRETKSAGFGEGMILAFNRTVDGVVKTVAGYKKLITKEVGLNNIGGPLAIGKVASDSFNISLSMFFRLMAIISINLGVINLFPIPVLDGGHIMFLGFEIINRGPLSRRKLEIAQRFGVSFLFLLIFIALFNDISRLFS